MNPKSAPKNRKVIHRMWAGFLNGQIHQERIDDQFGGKNIRVVMALFYTRREARKKYQDVRKVTVIEN